MRRTPIRILAVVAVLALVATPALTQKPTRHSALPNFHKVNDSLFRGGQPKSGGLELLRQMGIKSVVNLRDDDHHAEDERTAVEKAGLRYFNIPMGRWNRPDDTDIEQVLSIIDNPDNQPVFVHCAHGADRTGAVIAIYRISHEGWTSEQAKEEAKRYGLKPWQRGIKDYILDYYKRLSNHKPDVQ